MDTRYYITGIKHCGKSTVGLELSKRLNIPFYDLDSIIEQIVNMPVREFFRKEGKAGFYKAEIQAIITMQNTAGSFVCATGGGICDNKDAFNLLQTLGNTIYINTAFKTVYSRIIQNGIPPFLTSDNPELEFKEIYVQRNLKYKKLANIEVSGDDKTPDEICEYIHKRLKESQVARK